MAHGIDDPQASAKIETLFLAAHADGELGDDERAHFATVVGGFLGSSPSDDALGKLLSGFEADLARDGREARIAAIKGTLAAGAPREEALSLAVKLMATDGIVRTSERELILELAEALEIDTDRAADMVREASG